MHCPTCGKQIPENSTFCLHCGARVTAPSGSTRQQVSTEWEHKDFVYVWNENDRPYVNMDRPNSPSVADTRLQFWQGKQAEIRRLLQQWLDEGWEPIGEIGPASIQLRECKMKDIKNKNSDDKYGSLLSFGLLGLERAVQPYEFRVQMRHPKT
jgi:zinc-ribbon domain